MRLAFGATALLAAFSGIFAAPKPGAQDPGTPVYSYKVIHAYPHDPNAFTQGLIYLNGFLYESTGLNGRSSLRMVDLTTGRVIRQQAVPSQYFAEGLTNWKGNLVQLTWKAGEAFEYDLFSFQREKLFHYPGEGWGLTQDGRELIMSDGSADLRLLDPNTFREISRVHVTDSGAPVTELNELEYVRGEVYANVWQTNRSRASHRRRKSAELDRLHGLAFRERQHWPRRRSERDRLRPRTGPALCHGQAMAETVRDQNR